MSGNTNDGDSWRDHVYKSLQRYWPQEGAKVQELPIPACTLPVDEDLPPNVSPIQLPNWASAIGIKGAILVPTWAYQDKCLQWEHVDWIAVAFWYMENLAERAYESKYGPIHSYSFRLKGWDPQLWEHAWVNRIALFLRRWSSHHHKQDEETLHGPLPRHEIRLTHDVDAVSKTLPIRGKQAAFHSFNAMRCISTGRPLKALSHCHKGIQFLLGYCNYWCFETIRSMEKEFSQTSIFNFFAGKTGYPRSPREWLMDPSYDVHGFRLQTVLAQIKREGCTIGLHPTYDAWEDQARFHREKDNLENAVGGKVVTCRQHWLRFSFNSTWKNQQSCGIEEDTTLGFNDRPGFRNSSAISLNPWDPFHKKPMKIRTLPMLLMDSHLYDYNMYSGKDRTKEIEKWINEVKFVRGQATVIWHQRVFGFDYNWGGSYRKVLENI